MIIKNVSQQRESTNSLLFNWSIAKRTSKIIETKNNSKLK